jgi:type I restriction enzyme, R subunit
VPFLTENEIEQDLMALLEQIGYTITSDSVIGPDGTNPERRSYGDVILTSRLQEALERLNPTIPAEALEEAFKAVWMASHTEVLAENQRLHRLMVEGVPVEYYGPEGHLRGDQVSLIDFTNPHNNDWLAVNQLTVIEGDANRRPDVVVFLNGLPVAVIELKNPADESATVDAAFNQLQTYKTQIPSLFRTNALLITSDGLTARVGSLTADKERFMPWRTVDGETVLPKGSPELDTLIKGVLAPDRVLDLLKDFTFFTQIETQAKELKTVKILAGYHQYHAVRKAVASTVRATRPDGDRKVGVI